jgi:hypothetical protein
VLTGLPPVVWWMDVYCCCPLLASGLFLPETHVQRIVDMKITAFCDTVPCSLEVDRRFRGAYCLYHKDDRPYDTLLRRRCIPESRRLHSCRCQNLQSHRANELPKEAFSNAKSEAVYFLFSSMKRVPFRIWKYCDFLFLHTVNFASCTLRDSLCLFYVFFQIF